MKIQSIHIDGFGKFENRDIKLGKGVNIIYGQNEAGKTTMHNFLEFMLYGADKKPRGFDKSLQEAMKPWAKEIPYAGSMRVEYKGRPFEIRRDFTPGKERLEITDVERGQDVKEPELFLGQCLGGLTRGAFRSSVSIGQLSSKTGPSLVKELKGYVDNVGSTANPDLSAEKAVMFLRKKRAELSGQIEENAAKEYTASLSRIKNIDGELGTPDRENRVISCEEKKEELRRRIGAKEQEFLDVVDKVADETAVLRSRGIESEKDVEKMDAEGDALYQAYLDRRKEKKDFRRKFGMVLCVLIMAAAVYGYLTKALNLVVWAYAGAFAAALLFLIVLIVKEVKASRRLKEAAADLEKLLYRRIGEDSISSGAMKRLHEENHRYDEVLADRARDRSLKDDLEADIAGLRKQQVKAQEDVEEQHRIRYGVEELLSEQNDLRSRAAGLRLSIARNNKLKDDIDAVDIAIDTITELGATIRSRLGTYLNEEASRAIAAITRGKYSSMDVGSGNDVFLSTKEGMISVNNVSAGTLDQVYLAVRLAAARFIMHGESLVPVIFDDSFALYDDGRLKNAIGYLSAEYGGQSLIFTCHHREEEALEEGTYTLVEL